MKEYRLKKFYPSLPKSYRGEDTIVVVQREYVYEIHPSLKERLGGRLFTLEEVENYPEFWEEVKSEKDWEILKVISTKYNSFWGEGHILTIENPESYTHKDNLGEKTPWNIHTVKRVTDGEIFTIGDTTKTITSKSHHKIKSFEIRQKWKSKGIDRIWVNWDNNCGGNWLDSIKHYVEKPILITEDGVDIYEGDTYFRVLPNSPHITILLAGEYFSNSYAGAKFFSTREAAEQHILFNKKQLSLNDVFKIYPQFTKKDETKLTSHAEKLINFVKNEKV